MEVFRRFPLHLHCVVLTIILDALVVLLNIYSNSGKNRKGDLQDAAAMIGK
jgi:hypothetical protein